jgi:DNA invertase Pin-like site-specific DNA recombinase
LCQRVLLYFSHMLIGYARVSTDDQDMRLQIDALKRAGCKMIYEERASGSRTDRPELNKALAHGRKGDVVVVWKSIASVAHSPT